MTIGRFISFESRNRIRIQMTLTLTMKTLRLSRSIAGRGRIIICHIMKGMMVNMLNTPRS
jgi:hypothetical protein